MLLEYRNFDHEILMWCSGINNLHPKKYDFVLIGMLWILGDIIFTCGLFKRIFQEKRIFKNLFVGYELYFCEIKLIPANKVYIPRISSQVFFLSQKENILGTIFLKLEEFSLYSTSLVCRVSHIARKSIFCFN